MANLNLTQIETRKNDFCIDASARRLANFGKQKQNVSNGKVLFTSCAAIGPSRSQRILDIWSEKTAYFPQPREILLCQLGKKVKSIWRRLSTNTKLTSEHKLVYEKSMKSTF